MPSGDLRQLFADRHGADERTRVPAAGGVVSSCTFRHLVPRLPRWTGGDARVRARRPGTTRRHTATEVLRRLEYARAHVPVRYRRVFVSGADQLLRREESLGHVARLRG